MSEAPSQQPARTKKPIYKRVWFWIAIVIVVGIIGAALGGGGDSSTDSATTASTTATKAAEASITLKATATGNGTVIWGADGGTNNEQFTGTWEKTFTGDAAKKSYTVSVSGDFMGAADQQVTCQINTSGKEGEIKSGSGTAGSASCFGFGA